MEYFAKDVVEAVEIAKQMKSGGEANWFRGQLHTWPVLASYARCDEIGRENASRKIEGLQVWLKKVPGYQELGENRDSVTAIAQHYRIPTTMVDFTTEPQVAGFFASYDENPNNIPLNTTVPDTRSNGHFSCILCLNTNDFESELDEWLDGAVRPRLITINVDNLWRLQAQYGVFVDLPFVNELLIPNSAVSFSRISFSYTGIYPHIAPESIYPPRKSELEILLEQFFDSWAKAKAIFELQQIYESIGGHITSITASSSAHNLAPHPSWTNSEKWSGKTVEQYQDSATNTEKVFQINPDKTFEDIVTVIKQNLTISTDLRQKQVKWTVLNPKTGTSFPPIETRKKTYTWSENLNDIWDGMRKLPFTDEQILIAMINCLHLMLSHLHNYKDSMYLYNSVMGQVFGNNRVIEFGSDDGAYTRTPVSLEGISNAMRADLDRYTSFDSSDLGKHGYKLMTISNDPSILYDFEKIVNLFVQEIIPSQIVFRYAGDLIYFSPSRVTRFGPT